MIISHDHPIYRQTWRASKQKYNGAYYYSREIVDIMIPLIDTTRDWITINIPGVGTDHSIVFIHNNNNPERYEWLKRYRDLILVCGVPSTVDKVKHIGKAIYLPLSVNVAEVERYKAEKTKEVAYVGRSNKRKDMILPDGADIIEDVPREKMLKLMAEYKSIIAVGRTAIEGKVLGCNILTGYDRRYPEDIWDIVDTREAAKILQEKIYEIDKR